MANELARNDGPILALNIGSSSLKLGISLTSARPKRRPAL
jgi:hypothetical protein